MTRIIAAIALGCVVVYAPMLLRSARTCQGRGGVLVPDKLGGQVCVKKKGIIPLPGDIKP
jgi:hypothetical protein